MPQIIIAYPNRADAATLSAGTWDAALVLNNLKDGDIDNVARSSSGANSSTRFAVDLGADYPVRAVALVNHTVASNATWRVRANTAAAGAITPGSGSSFTYDSGVVNVKQLTFQGDAPADWGAKYMLLHCLDKTVRYLSVELFVAASIDLGRLFIGGGLQPAVNPEFGAFDDELEELSGRQTSVAGKDFMTERSRRRRGVAFNLNTLTDSEADWVSEAQHEAGIVDELLYVPDPGDMAKSQRYGFLARFEKLDRIGAIAYGIRGVPVALREKL
jgi:hypothetical protein